MSAYLKRLQIDSVEESTEHPSAYLKRVEVVEVVDQDGNPWEPVPPVDPLEVADGKGANWVGTNVYELGETVEAKTAEYTGGLEPITYRYRFQTKAVGSDSWVNQSWNNTTNDKNSVFYTINSAGQLKFQSQARDSSDPTVQLNSITGIKTIAQSTIGVLSIAPPSTSAEPSGIVVCDAVISGDATNTMFTWSIRSGPGTISSTFNFGNQIQVQVNADASHGQSIQVQCDATNSNSSDSPKSTVSTIVVQIP